MTGMSTNASSGSNFLGDFSADVMLKSLETASALWEAALAGSPLPDAAAVFPLM